jgi:hypothetical protein
MALFEELLTMEEIGAPLGFILEISGLIPYHYVRGNTVYKFYFLI